MNNMALLITGLPDIPSTYLKFIDRLIMETYYLDSSGRSLTVF